MWLKKPLSPQSEHALSTRQSWREKPYNAEILVHFLNGKGKEKKSYKLWDSKRTTKKKESDSFELYFGYTAN